MHVHTCIYYACIAHLSLAPAQAVLSPDVVELVVVEGAPVSLTCTPSGEAVIVVNNVTTSTSSFQTAMAERNDTGFYQCLTSSSVDSVYLLVACKLLWILPLAVSTPFLHCVAITTVSVTPIVFASYSLQNQLHIRCFPCFLMECVVKFTSH